MSDEPTGAEALVIAAMQAAHPTWTAERYRDGWSVCDGGGLPVLAWDPDVLVAWEAAEAAAGYDPGSVVLRWVRRMRAARAVLEVVVLVESVLLLALSLVGFLGWLGVL